jgi:hypothetical protein
MVHVSFALSKDTEASSAFQGVEIDRPHQAIGQNDTKAAR